MSDARWQFKLDLKQVLVKMPAHRCISVEFWAWVQSPCATGFLFSIIVDAAKYKELPLISTQKTLILSHATGRAKVEFE